MVPPHSDKNASDLPSGAPRRRGSVSTAGSPGPSQSDRHGGGAERLDTAVRRRRTPGCFMAAGQPSMECLRWDSAGGREGGGAPGAARSREGRVGTLPRRRSSCEDVPGLGKPTLMGVPGSSAPTPQGHCSTLSARLCSGRGGPGVPTWPLAPHQQPTGSPAASRVLRGTGLGILRGPVRIVCDALRSHLPDTFSGRGGCGSAGETPRR